MNLEFSDFGGAEKIGSHLAAHPSSYPSSIPHCKRPHIYVSGHHNLHIQVLVTPRPRGPVIAVQAVLKARTQRRGPYCALKQPLGNWSENSGVLCAWSRGRKAGAGSGECRLQAGTALDGVDSLPVEQRNWKEARSGPSQPLGLQAGTAFAQVYGNIM